MLAGGLRSGQERAMKTYIAYVYKDPHSSFGVSFPDLPGCYGAGETHDEAIRNAKISLREYALALADEGDNMPKPRTHGELASDVSEAIEMDSAAFIIEVPLLTVGSKKRVNVSMDDRVLAAIDKACELTGLNRSAFLSNVALNWLQESMGAIVATPEKKRRRRPKLALA
jgi:predicted RNase H-like HicB family nuclease